MNGIVYPEEEGKSPSVLGHQAPLEIGEMGRRESDHEPSGSMVLGPPSLGMVKPGFALYEKEITKWEGEAKVLEVRDDESRGQAAMLGGAAAQLIKKLDAERKRILEPYAAFTKSLNAFVAGFTDRLQAISTTTKGKERRFVEIQEMARREAEKKAQEAADKLQAKINKDAAKKGIEPIQVQAPIIPSAPTKIRTDSGTISYSVKTWKAELVNPDNPADVPREYCSPDMKKINQAVKEGVREITGVKIWEDEDIRYRT